MTVKNLSYFLVKHFIPFKFAFWNLKMTRLFLVLSLWHLNKIEQNLCIIWTESTRKGSHKEKNVCIKLFELWYCFAFHSKMQILHLKEAAKTGENEESRWGKKQQRNWKMDCAGANVPKRMKIYKMEQHVQNRTRKEKSELEIKRTMRKKKWSKTATGRWI